MMSKALQRGFVCLAAASCLAMWQPVLGQNVTLKYKPVKGEEAVYNLQLHAEVKDDAGNQLTTHSTSLIKISVADIETETAADGKTAVKSTTVDVKQENAALKATSGEVEKVFSSPDTTIRLILDKNGDLKNVVSGTADNVLLASVTAAFKKLGAVESPRTGDKWKITAKLPCQGEEVTAHITYTLVGAGLVGDQECLFIRSECSLTHTFTKGPVRKLELRWTGEASYADKIGRFTSIVVEGKGTAELEDGLKARLTNLSIQLTPPEKHAMLPGAKGSFAGFTAMRPPPLFMIPLLAAAGLLALSLKARRRLVRQAVACGLGLLLVLQGVPIAPAHAMATPGVFQLVNSVNQLLAGALGMTTAGAAGICMGGLDSAPLGVPYSAGSGAAGMNLGAAFIELPADLAAAAPVGAAGGGFFSTSNLLLGGGVLAASAGAGIAASGGGGGSDTVQVICPTSAPAPLSTTLTEILISIGPNGASPDNPADIVDVYFNGLLMRSDCLVTTDTMIPDGNGVSLNVGANTLGIVFKHGGSNNCVIVDVAAFDPDTGDPLLAHPLNVMIGPGTGATWTINRAAP